MAKTRKSRKASGKLTGAAGVPVKKGLTTRSAAGRRPLKKKSKALVPDLARRRGGVSPRRHAPAIRGAKTKPVGGKKQPGRFPNFRWHGGPVIASPEVHTSFWGSLWADAQHQARAARLNQFHQDLLASGFMNVLSQYGVGNGAGQAGRFAGRTFMSDVPSTLTNAVIQATIQSSIDRGVLPEPGEPANVALIIYLDENIGIEDPADQLVLCEPTNDNAFGYHEFFTTRAGHKFYYAVIPGLTDACLQESCPGGDARCSLRLSLTQEQRQTQVASHEFAEMVTDPELDAWLDAKAGENGDICNGESASITVGANTWNVQRTYSKTDDMASRGRNYCLAEAAALIPRLTPGP